MRAFIDPVAALRAFFASQEPPPYRSKIRDACTCWACMAFKARPATGANHSGRKPLGEGQYGIRAKGVECRYRELTYMKNKLTDVFNGRPPGVDPDRGGPHHIYRVQKMPRPDRINSERGENLVRTVSEAAAKYRVPLLKLGDENEYRQELIAEALVHLCAAPITPKQALDRAEKKLEKLHRELALNSHELVTNPDQHDE